MTAKKKIESICLPIDKIEGYKKNAEFMYNGNKRKFSSYINDLLEKDDERITKLKQQ